MKSLRTIGLALSVIFGCLLLALLAELYYLLWWKKRITRRGIEDGPGKELFYFFCRKKPSSSSLKPQEICSSNSLVHEPQPQEQSHGDSTMDSSPSWLKEESMEAELLRLSGPPRFLFTIKEETKEDLESEDGKSRTRRSLSDVLLQESLETPPFLTPTTSPPYFTPPLTPINPLFESTTDFEFNSFARPSPPPTFKFLRDAEEKLYRRSRILLHEEAQKDVSIQEIASTSLSLEAARDGGENGSFVRLICPRNREGEGESVSVSQVLPLASSPPPTSHSPSNFRSIHIRSFTR